MQAAAGSAAAAAAGGGGGARAGAKVALVTGANTGIGYHTALALARQGFRVVLAGRDAPKLAAARASIAAAAPAAELEQAVFDLADLESVRGWCDRALAAGAPLDVLVLNAGVMAPPARLETAQGHELQMGVNHLGHFLVAHKLAPLLAPGARVVSVASAAHLFGTISFDDLDCRRAYRPWAAYGASKLANVLFAFELARRLEAAGSTATANALHPGVVDTELSRYILPPGEQPAWWARPLLALGRRFLLSPEQGAATSVHVATSPDVEGVTRKYFAASKVAASSKESLDAGVARRLWEVSAEMVGVPEALPVRAG